MVTTTATMTNPTTNTASNDDGDDDDDGGKGKKTEIFCAERAQGEQEKKWHTVFGAKLHLI